MTTPTLTTTSNAETAQVEVWMQTETQSERLMRLSNWTADLLLMLASQTPGTFDAATLAEVVDELAHFSRIAEVVEKGPMEIVWYPPTEPRNDE